MRTATCKHCTNDFSYDYKVGRRRTVCDTCKAYPDPARFRIEPKQPVVVEPPNDQSNFESLVAQFGHLAKVNRTA